MATPPAVTASALSVDNLHVSYGRTRAVDGVSFKVAWGEIFGLLGPNGAGKTSTLSAIEGLVPCESGLIHVAGIEVRARPRAAKAALGVQLQSASFQSELTLVELVRLHAGLYGLALDRAAARSALATVGLQDGSKKLSKLSGGQQRRFSLLLAVVHDPPILLLDEPTGGLDPQSRRALWQNIESQRADGRAVLLTTHSMEEAQAVCGRIAILHRGQVIALDTPTGLVARYADTRVVRAVAHGTPTLEDVFIALTGGIAHE
jgi:ABC-2 type transport system ATP-binding protein